MKSTFDEHVKKSVIRPTIMTLPLCDDFLARMFHKVYAKFEKYTLMLYIYYGHLSLLYGDNFLLLSQFCQNLAHKSRHCEVSTSLGFYFLRNPMVRISCKIFLELIAIVCTCVFNVKITVGSYYYVIATGRNTLFSVQFLLKEQR